MIPDSNNVYGIITAPHGMESVFRAIELLVPQGRACIYRSSYNGADTLRLSSDRVEFESDPLEDGVQHLFNGGVGGSLEEVMDFVRALSGALHREGIEHRFEIYDDEQELVKLMPE